MEKRVINEELKERYRQFIELRDEMETVYRYRYWRDTYDYKGYVEDQDKLKSIVFLVMNFGIEQVELFEKV